MSGYLEPVLNFAWLLFRGKQIKLLNRKLETGPSSAEAYFYQFNLTREVEK